MGIYTGLRISELLSLRIKDVWEHGKVKDYVCVARKHVKKQTNGRSIPLHEQAKQAISVLIQELIENGKCEPDMPLFQSRKGQGHKAISRIHAHCILKEAIQACGLSGKVAFHSLRKSFAMAIYEKLDKDIHATQIALGHLNLNSTIHYLCADRAKVENAILTI
jgi:site-specific recombinase XerD